MAGTSYLYRVVSCCDTRIFGEFQSTVNIPTGTYTYSGPTYIDPDNGFEWENGQCYQIIKVGTGGTPTGAILPDTDLTRTLGDCLTEPCPCASDNRYLIFEKCCDNSLIYFKSTQDGGYLLGLKEYTGAPTYLLENICYRVDTVAVGIGPIVDNTMWNALPLAPNASNYTGPTDITIDCTDETYQVECPLCVEKCFLLTKCDGTIIYTNTNLSLYIGQFININDQDYQPIPGDWYVIETDAPCDPESYFSSLQVTASGLQPDCPNECYEVTGTPTIILYVDEDQVTQEILGASKFCSIVPPIVMGGTGTITNYGLCVDNECPELCYIFTNCITSETLTVVSNTPNISQYASQNNVVTLNGYDGCWSIELSEECECPVNVTILQVFDDCPSCLPIIAYKFTNCNNQTIVRYSLDDYSAYVGKTVELDCGECWFVTLIDYMPPATQPITILFTFDSCLACNRTYYKLTDCLDPNNVTYTYTDLSSLIPSPVSCNDCIHVSFTYDGIDYEFDVPKTDTTNGKNQYTLGGITIDGLDDSDINISWGGGFGLVWSFLINGSDAYINSADTECPISNNWVYDGGDFEVENLVTTECTALPVIKIKGCDSCFTVEETREPINAGIVTVTDSFIDCPECLETFPCVCNKITNQDTIAKDFIYLNCLFEEVTINLQPNETSDKVCLINWVLTPEEEALVYIEHFGDCINNQCPVEPLPKRKVKPGYSTPSCDPEKYEKFACKSSEILYKTVLEKRYGISNCCPDVDLGERWIVKKELADLQGAVDPNYVCTPVQSCCNNTSTCGCGCNSSPKTCNSQ